MSTSATTLTYSLTKSEFSLSIKNATKATYTIEYQAKKDKETITEALKGQVTGKGTISATHFAGTESGGAKVPHTVIGGTLKATVTGTDNSQSELTQIFTINQQGQLKVVSESSEKLAGSVLGASTTDLTMPVSSAAAAVIPRPVATPAPLAAQETARQQNMETTEEPATDSLITTTLPLAIGGIILLLVGMGVMYWWLTRKPQPSGNNQA